MERLQGKNVLITGASSGIGQAIAVRFAAEGANIAIIYRSGAERAEATRAMARAARSNGAGRELVANEQFVDNELDFFGIQVDMSAPPALEPQIALRFCVDFRIQIVLLGP